MRLVSKLAAVQYSAVISTLIGKLGLLIQQGAVTRIHLVQESCPLFVDDTSSLVADIINELQHYFAGQLTSFQIPFLLQGTSFQQVVWRALLSIPYGKTVTYGQLASQLKTSPRAIGNACRTNPLIILVPCHRVLGASGLGGYGGKTTGHQLGIKRWLLELEQAVV